MRKNLTELVFILDQSGSMSGLEKDTIGGYNSFLEKQKIPLEDVSGNDKKSENESSSEKECYVTTVLFSNDSTVVHDRIPIGKIEKMTVEQYSPAGCTALLDAIGNSINHIGNIHKYARDEDVPEKTIFVIITDGEENSSVGYTYDKIKKMISRQQEKFGWEFLFLGANIDAIEEASKLGICEDRAVRYECDSKGTNLNFETVGSTVLKMRAGYAVNSEWKAEIEDYEKTKNSKKKGKKSFLNNSRKI